MREYLLVLCVAAAVTYLLTPVARRFAVRTGAVAEPRDRDVHAVPTPRLGGLAMYGGVCAAFLVAQQLPALSRVFRTPTCRRSSSPAGSSCCSARSTTAWGSTR